MLVLFESVIASMHLLAIAVVPVVDTGPVNEDSVGGGVPGILPLGFNVGCGFPTCQLVISCAEGFVGNWTTVGTSWNLVVEVTVLQACELVTEVQFTATLRHRASWWSAKGWKKSIWKPQP